MYLSLYASQPNTYINMAAAAASHTSLRKSTAGTRKITASITRNAMHVSAVSNGIKKLVLFGYTKWHHYVTFAHADKEGAIGHAEG